MSAPHQAVPADSGDASARWQELWTHRPALLAIARPRCASVDDAEDVVSEALLRGATKPDLRLDEAGAWLTRVVMNLCVDTHRERLRTDQRVRRVTAQMCTEPSPEEAVCDRDEAAYAAERVAGLPPRQREALVLLSAELSVGEVARRLEASYKTAESLLSRARTAVRRSLLGLLILTGIVRKSLSHTTPAIATVVAAGVLAALAVTAGGWSPGRTAPSPSNATAGPGSSVSEAGGFHDTQRALPPQPVGREPVPARRVERRAPQTAVPTFERKRATVDEDNDFELPGTSREYTEETFLESVQRCVFEGVTVSAEYIGCTYGR